MQQENKLEKNERRIINSCQTCRVPIYEGEPIYGSSRGQSSGYTRGVYGGRGFGGGDYHGGAYGGYHSSTHASESWAQCAWCYDQWQAEVKANKRFWLWWWLGSIVLILIATIATILMFPGEWGESGKQNISWYRIKLFEMGSWKVPLLAPIILFGGLILARILGYFFQPNVNRYKMRRRPAKIKI